MDKIETAPEQGHADSKESLEDLERQISESISKSFDGQSGKDTETEEVTDGGEQETTDSKSAEDLDKTGKENTEDVEDAEPPSGTDLIDKDAEDAKGETETLEGKDKAPEKGQAPETETKDLLITDKYIKELELPEEEANYLEKFKGKSIKEALKSLANAQKFLGKKKEDIPQNPVDSYSLRPEVIAKKNEALAAKMKREFEREFPEYEPPKSFDRKSKEYREWAAEMNYKDPEGLSEFKAKLIEEDKAMTQNFKRQEYAKENYFIINRQILNNEAQEIKTYLKDKLKIAPEDFGIDLKEDDKGEIPALSNMIVKNNNAVPEFFNYLDGIPILKQGEVSKRFIADVMPEILEKLRIKSRTEGFETASTKRPKEEKSLATANVAGQRQAPGLTRDKISKITSIDEIDKLIREDIDKTALSGN